MAACLVFSGTCYVCQGEAPGHGEGDNVESTTLSTALSAAQERDIASPCTPVFSLIWGVYELRRERALEAVRCPVLTSLPLTDLCRASVKVGAKRFGELNPDRLAAEVTVSIPAWPRCTDDFFGTTLPVQPIVLPDDASIAAALARRVEAMRTVLAAQQHRLSAQNRAVCALLLDAHGTLLLEAWNSNAVNRLRHAETNLVLGWWERNRIPFPAGSRVAVSLKPCRMCAAMLFRASTRVTPVVYLEDDPGPLARATAYDAAGLPLQKLRWQ